MRPVTTILLASVLLCTTHCTTPEDRVATVTPDIDTTVLVEIELYNADGVLTERGHAAVSRQGDTIRHGPFVMFHDNGAKLSEGTYRLGERHGRYTTWWKSGAKEAECTYDNATTVGAVRWWYETGQIAKQEHYEDGLLHGEYVRWYENGKIREEIAYRKGIRHGPFIRWDRHGNKESEGEYRNDKKVSETVY